MRYRSGIHFALGLLGLAVAASGCSFQHSSSLASTAPTSAAASAVSSFVGTWHSVSGGGVASKVASVSTTAATTTTLSNCSTFTWAVSSQVGNTIVGTLTAHCGSGSGADISSTANALLTTPDSASLSLTGNAALAGSQTCFFSITGTATKSGDTITFPYAGTTCFGPASGTETLQRTTTQPAPPPPPSEPAPAPSPAPDPAPAPPPPPAGFDLGQSQILNSPTDLASWPITTTLTELDINPEAVHPEFSKQDGPGRWPDVTPPGWGGPLQYTLGMCLKIGGSWYCSAVVEFWYGLYESGGPNTQFAQNWFYDPIRWGPMSGHQPAVGETIGFFVCAGDCRNNLAGDLSPVKERSNVVLVAMPPPSGAHYSFSGSTAFRRR